MNQSLRVFILTILMAVAYAGAAYAAESASFVVLPFEVKGPQSFSYLERSIPQTLSSRLFWQGRVEPVAKPLAASQKFVASAEAAEKVRADYAANYVVWGSVAIIGQDSTLEVHVQNADGKKWRYSEMVQANQLMTAIKRVSDDINKDVFARMPQGAAPSSTPSEGAQRQLNPNMVVNETTGQGVYLNPQFRYAASSSGEGTNLRSQALPFSSVGMEVCDANGDGKSEIFILTNTDLLAYNFENGRLMPITEFKFPVTVEALSIRSLPQSSGKSLLVVSGVSKDGTPNSSVFSFDGKTLSQDIKNIRYFLSVAKLPPDFRATIVGQKGDPKKVVGGGVYEMMISGGTLSPSSQIVLPSEANVWGFTFLAGGFDEPGTDKVVVLSPSEKLRTYSSKGSRLAETDEPFSGSAVGLEMNSAMPGLGKDTSAINEMFYIPIRMLSVDFDGDGKSELLVNRPISTAASIFPRYRFFPQSEIHSLFWDGIGLNLQWKTNRIKGSVVDFTVADANNDGILDLVVCVNTHPGAVGASQRKTIVVVYPLDLGATTGAPMPDLEQ